MDRKTQRLDKYLANLGISSRRGIKKFLKEQILTVNGDRVRESGTRIVPEKDDIRLNGKKMQASHLVYYAVNKPKGIISTTADEYGRMNVISLIPSNQRIYPVGRLDKDTTGLLILTNDGELTHKLTHPKFHVFKVYHLTVSGRVEKSQLSKLRNGIILEDGITAPAEVTVLKELKTKTLLSMTIHEGRNRQIRRMCDAVGIDLLELERVKFGPVALANLKSGKYRELTKKEVEALRKATYQNP